MADTIEKEKVHVVEEVSSTSRSLESIEPLDAALERRVRNKCDLHLMPVLYILLLLAFLDRVNIGNARIQGLEKDLNMKGNDFNIALFVFFITYILCEVPSNFVLKHVRPSIWLSGIIFAWGEEILFILSLKEESNLLTGGRRGYCPARSHAKSRRFSGMSLFLGRV